MSRAKVKSVKKKKELEIYLKEDVPMSLEEFNERLNEAREGEITSHEDFLKEMELWG